MSCEFGFRGLEMYSEACLLLGTCVPCQQSVTITSPHFVFSEVLTLDHHFDRPSCSGLCSLKCLQGLLKLEPVSDKWLDIHFATGHHSNCCRVAVGVAENASDVHLTHGSIDNGHHNLGFAEANKDQAASRLGCHDPKPDAGLDATALNGDIRALPAQQLPHISSHLLCALLPRCLVGVGSAHAFCNCQSVLHDVGDDHLARPHGTGSEKINKAYRAGATYQDFLPKGHPS